MTRTLIASLMASVLLLACSSREAGPQISPAPLHPGLPPALWVAYNPTEDTVGFAIRLEPGTSPDEDPWRFKFAAGGRGVSISCTPDVGPDAWRFQACEGMPDKLTLFRALLPRKPEGRLDVSFSYEGKGVTARLRQIPERDEPTASDNVTLEWRHPLSEGCGVMAGIWAEDGVVFAPCFTGLVELLDARTGDLLSTVRPPARTSDGTAVLEVVARNGRLYTATTDQGVAIYDVRDPRRPTLLGQFVKDAGRESSESVTNVHNLTLSPKGDLLFVINQSHPRTDVRILDVTNPAEPREVGRYLIPDNQRYFGGAHDIYLVERDGRLIAYLNRLDAGFHVLDVTNPASVREIGLLQWGDNFSHSGWPFEVNGKQYFVHTDEGYDGAVRVLDVSNASLPKSVSRFQTRTGVSSHNVRVVDGIAFISYYLDGLRILDLRNPERPKEIGHYDTVPREQERGLFQGAWGVHLDSGLIFVSDMEGGVFALRFHGAP